MAVMRRRKPPLGPTTKSPTAAVAISAIMSAMSVGDVHGHRGVAGRIREADDVEGAAQIVHRAGELGGVPPEVDHHRLAAIERHHALAEVGGHRVAARPTEDAGIRARGGGEGESGAVRGAYRLSSYGRGEGGSTARVCGEPAAARRAEDRQGDLDRVVAGIRHRKAGHEPGVDRVHAGEHRGFVGRTQRAENGDAVFVRRGEPVVVGGQLGPVRRVGRVEGEEVFPADGAIAVNVGFDQVAGNVLEANGILGRHLGDEVLHVAPGQFGQRRDPQGLGAPVRGPGQGMERTLVGGGRRVD